MDRHAPGNPAHPPFPDSGAEPVGPDPHDLPPPEAVKTALKQFAEVREYAAYYVAAKIDSIKLSVRRAGIFAALGLIGLFAAGAVIVTGVVFVCAGLAQLFTTWFGGRAWAGNLVVGILLLALVAGGAWFGMIRLTGSSRRKTVHKYELRRTRQRADFGHDVARRAAEAKDRR